MVLTAVPGRKAGQHLLAPRAVKGDFHLQTLAFPVRPITVPVPNLECRTLRPGSNPSSPASSPESACGASWLKSSRRADPQTRLWRRVGFAAHRPFMASTFCSRWCQRRLPASSGPESHAENATPSCKPGCRTTSGWPRRLKSNARAPGNAHIAQAPLLRQTVLICKALACGKSPSSIPP